MTQYVPLDRRTHGDLQMGPTRDHLRFRTTMLVPLIVDELAQAAREYPIVFLDRTVRLPFAIVGLKPETNAFVTEDGTWVADYVPMDVARHPFGLTKAKAVEGDAQTGRHVLCIDPGADEFSDPAGAPLFQADGSLSPEAKSKADLAHRLVNRSGVTMAMVAALDDAGLLITRRVKLDLGHEIRESQDFRVVDETRLNALPDADFLALRKKGLFPLIYAQLLSMANFRQGRLAGQDRVSASRPSSTGFEFNPFVTDDATIDLP